MGPAGRKRCPRCSGGRDLEETQGEQEVPPARGPEGWAGVAGESALGPSALPVTFSSDNSPIVSLHLAVA